MMVISCCIFHNANVIQPTLLVLVQIPLVLVWSLVLQMLALVPRSNQACRALMARWLIAFCRASKWYIREDEPLAKELTPWLEPNELQQLVRAWGLA
jgi:hypothetical protein